MKRRNSWKQSILIGLISSFSVLIALIVSAFYRSTYITILMSIAAGLITYIGSEVVDKFSNDKER